MPANKLTQAEKDARGTRRKSRDISARPLREVRRELRDTRAALKDLQFNLQEAGVSIKKDGVIIEYPVLDSTGTPQIQKKANPALKVQREALSGIKELKRSLVFLREEETLAAAKKNATDEFSEFD